MSRISCSERRMVVKLNWFVRNVSCDTRASWSSVASAISTRSCSPFKKVFQREGLLPEPLPLRVFLVHPGAGAIFLGRTRVIERPHTIQERRDRLAALRQLQRQHAGAVDADIRAIHRVVIDEDEAL